MTNKSQSQFIDKSTRAVHICWLLANKGLMVLEKMMSQVFYTLFFLFIERFVARRDAA